MSGSTGTTKPDAEEVYLEEQFDTPLRKWSVAEVRDTIAALVACNNNESPCARFQEFSHDHPRLFSAVTDPRMSTDKGYHDATMDYINGMLEIRKRVDDREIDETTAGALFMEHVIIRKGMKYNNKAKASREDEK